MTIFRKATFTAVLPGLLLVFASIAEADVEAARQAAGAAEAMVSKKDFDGAKKALSNVDCQVDAGCQTLVEFSLGWLYESWADSSPQQAGEFLAQALQHYRIAAKLNPKNGQIWTNLALVARRTGDDKMAIDAVQRNIKSNPEQAFENYLFLGELLQAMGEDTAALEAVRSAVALRPADAQANQRLLELYRQIGSPKDLYELGDRFRNQLPELAATGFAYAILAAYAKDPAFAERALPMWVAARSDLGTLTAASLDSLPSPKTWESPGLVQLHGVVQNDKAPPGGDAIGWWMQDAMRRDAMARLLRLKGNRLRGEAEELGVTPDQRRAAQSVAIQFLANAVRVAPEYDAYLYGPLVDSTNVKLDAATDLVTLHHSLKSGGDLQGLSGISEGELENMTDMLFSGKAGAYATGQLSAIQRYHTVLGMIYYETGRDTSGWADNATFQLSNALRTADRIAERDPARYQPLPELHDLLAEVYQRREMPEESAKSYLSAAMGYLETDNLPSANRALAQAKSNGATSSQAVAIGKVLDCREAIAKNGAALVHLQSETGEVSLDSDIGWLGETGGLDLPKAFVAGQKFKMYADLGSQLADEGNAELADYVNALALNAASSRQTLTSPADIRRLKSVVDTRTRVAPQAPVSGAVIFDRGIDSPQPGNKQMWALPAATGNVVIQVDKNVIDDSRKIAEQDKAVIRTDTRAVDKKKAPVAPTLDTDN